MGSKGKTRVAPRLAAASPLAAAALLAAASLVWLAGCAGGRHVPPGEMNVLLVTLDTTRPDELGCYGSEEGLTPHLDALAREGTVFENVIAPVPITVASHASILTGLYPFRHGVRANGFYRLGEEQVSVAEMFQAKGVATAAVIGAFVLDHSFGLNQGFDTYEDDMGKRAGAGQANPLERRADDVTQSALGWLREHGDRRFFLWVHYFDPHFPYEPPPAYALYGSDDRGRYRGEIAYMDANVGRLVAALKELKLYDRTAIVAAGDHGEAFGEHGELGHGLCMYNSTLRVPLVVRLPRVEGVSSARGRRVAGRVSLVDVAPTLLELAGIEAAVSFDGRSLVLCLGGKGEAPDRRLYAETAEGKLTRGWSQLSGIYAGEWKYILAPRPELYDLAADPGEERNQAPALSARASELEAELVRLVSQAPPRPAAPRQELNSQAIESLRSLGYLTGASLPQDEVLQQVDTDLVAACTSGRDPKDMIEPASLIDRGVRYLGEGKPQEALRVVREARDKGGESLELLQALAPAFAELQMVDSALVAHQKILALLPDAAAMSSSQKATYEFVLNNMGVLYTKTGRLDRAEEAYRKAIASSPGSFQYHLNLALLYQDKGEFASADREFTAALDLAPATGEASQQIKLAWAYSLYRRGQLAEARKRVEEILATNPRDPRAQQLMVLLTAPLSPPPRP